MVAQVLAHNAVHAAFAGYTGCTVGLVNTHYVYLPIPVVIQAPRKVICSLIEFKRSYIKVTYDRQSMQTALGWEAVLPSTLGRSRWTC